MNYFGARYYDADIALWTSVDPMREYSSGYTYVGNNPIIKIDPDGMQSRYPSVGGSITGPVGNSFSTTGPVQRPNQSPPLSDYAWGNLNATYGLISGAGATATGIGMTAVNPVLGAYLTMYGANQFGFAMADLISNNSSAFDNSPVTGGKSPGSFVGNQISPEMGLAFSIFDIAGTLGSASQGKGALEGVMSAYSIFGEVKNVYDQSLGVMKDDPKVVDP